MAIIWSIFNVHSEYGPTNTNWKIETFTFLFYILPFVPTEPSALIDTL